MTFPRETILSILRTSLWR